MTREEATRRNTMQNEKRLVDAKNDNEKVLRAICALSNNIYGIGVVKTKDIMACTKLSKYKVIQNIHLLREDGLVKRASMGCPAQVSCGEYNELICEAAPPVNGWELTKKGYESAEYKAAEAEFMNGLAERANGKQEVLTMPKEYIEREAAIEATKHAWAKMDKEEE